MPDIRSFGGRGRREGRRERSEEEDANTDTFDIIGEKEEEEEARFRGER